MIVRPPTLPEVIRSRRGFLGRKCICVTPQLTLATTAHACILSSAAIPISYIAESVYPLS